MPTLPKGIMFDIDDTLTASKQAITGNMADALGRLADMLPVALVSGAGLPQMMTQIMSHLPQDVSLDHFFLFPTSGAQAYAYKNGNWNELYALSFSPEEKALIKRTAEAIIHEHARTKDLATYGEQIEDRGSSVAVSLLGQDAPLGAKQGFDPDYSLRRELIALMEPTLNMFEMKIGGMTTIDITKKGIDKAYAVKQFSELVKSPEETLVYVGDALEHDGNDSAVLRTNIQTHAVHSLEDTREFIESIIALSA